MSKLLFVDDEPENIRIAIEILEQIIPETQIFTAETVSEAITTLSQNDIDLIVMDIFIPLGKDLHLNLGPRGKRYQDNMRHLGGLAILDFIEKMAKKPKVLAHTACTDYALIEILGDIVVDRIPKPAAIEVLISEVQKHLSK